VSLKPTLLAAVLLTACTGEIVGPRSAPGTVGGPTVTDRPEWFACTPGADPSSEVVLRLTPTQYRNSLEDLLGRAFTPTQLAPLWTANAARLDAIPVDGSTHRAELTYDSMDQRISPLLVTPQFELSTAIGEWIANDTTRLATFTRFFGGASCTTPMAAGCVDAVIDGLGARALRRPLDADDRTTYRGAFDDTTYGGYRALIAAFLMSPDFLFRTEFRGEAVASRTDLTALTSYEIANRLSFALTNSMPDEALLAAAAAQFTGDGHSVESQAARLLQTPRARTQYEHFYRQWLRLDRVPGINPSAVSALELTYPDGSAPSLPANTDLEQLRLDAFDEMVELMTWYSERGSLHDAIVGDVSFAKLYGVPVWNGAEDSLVHFPAGQRAGLFTRAGYLLSGYPDTNPVMRGARLRVEYLCDVMEPPANTTPPANYMPPTVPTVRNVVTAKTEIAGSACQGCHQRSINPLGFPFESYDAFGRYRTQEPLHDMTGAVTSWVPVEASTQPDLDRNGDLHRAADGVSLSALLADSQRLHACFARHTFRYVLGRKELTAQDGCVLAGMERAAGTGTIQDLMKSLTRSTDFTLRRMPAGN
jgi:Protein of unknown function (DUF1592)/Protein of unknown function (DUF1588)/Protein of unknown function (DUF1595)/Protein of unknown function (DUF1585)